MHRDAIMNYGRVLNIPGFQVCHVSSYVSVAQSSEYAKNMAK